MKTRRWAGWSKTALKEVGYESEELHKKVRIRHPLDILANDIGVERIKEKVKRPLKGLKVIPLLRLSPGPALCHLR